MSRQNLITIGLVVALVAASLFFGYRCGRNSVTPKIVTRTEYKTIRVKDPAPALSFNTGNLIFVPVEAVKSKSDSTIHLAPLDAPTALPDSIAGGIVVELPEEIKEYKNRKREKKEKEKKHRSLFNFTWTKHIKETVAELYDDMNNEEV